MSKRVLFRIVALVLAPLVALLLAEGGVSLFTGRSLLRAAQTGWTPIQIRMLDAQRLAAQAVTEGPFAVAVDPEVSFRMKGRFTMKWLGVSMNTDEVGMRVRLGPSPEADATRIVILGDSVAFGLGLEDDATIAHQLEELLAGTMAPGAPRPVVTTVACPGWSARNAFRYLDSRLDAIDPDVVIYLPVRNDLDDSYGVLETGHRSVDLDPAVGITRPHMTSDHHTELLVSLAPRMPVARIERILETGGADAVDFALRTDITPESHRRFDALVEGLGHLERRLRRRAAHLLVTFLWEQPFRRILEDRIRTRLPSVPLLGFFDTVVPEDTLEDDPHPNAACAGAAAWRLAGALVEHGWVPRAGFRDLPPEDPRYVGRQMQLRDAEERARELAKLRAACERFLESTIDLTDGTGFHQIYGGVAGDGTVGRGLMAVLKNPGAQHLDIELEARTAIPDLHPLHLEVSIGDRVLGVVNLGAPREDPPERVTHRLPIPEDLQDSPYLEISIRSDRWTQLTIAGTTRLAAFRLIALRLR